MVEAVAPVTVEEHVNVEVPIDLKKEREQHAQPDYQEAEKDHKEQTHTKHLQSTQGGNNTADAIAQPHALDTAAAESDDRRRGPTAQSVDGRTRVGRKEDGKKRSQSCESSERKEKATAANLRHGTPGHAKSTQGQSLVCNVDPNTGITLRQDAAKTEEPAESPGNQRGLDRSIHPDDSSSKEQTEVKEEYQTRHSRVKNAWPCLTIFPQSPKLNIRTVAASFLSLILCCSAANTQSLDQKYQTHCRTHRAVFENESTNITCDFPHDVRQVGLTFEVIRYDFDKTIPLRDLIASCIWNTVKKNHSCVLKPGYDLDMSAIGTTATLTIHNASKEHVGRYFCGDQTALTTEQKECNLEIKGSRTTCSVTPWTVSVGSPTSVTCQFNYNLTRTKEAFYITRTNHNGTVQDVLRCTWNSEGGLICKVENGYVFDNASFSSSVTVNITSTEHMHSGTYSCRTFSFDKRLDVSSCSLNVTEMMTTDLPATISAVTIRMLPIPVSSPTACQSKTLVRKGHSTTMTCFVPKSIDSRTAEIRVKRVITKSKSSDDSDLEEVLHCNGSSTCSEEEGYRLVDAGTEALVVEILNFTEKHEGKFLCTFTANQEWETPMACLQTLAENDDTSGASRLFPTTPCAEMAAHLAKEILLPLLSSLLTVF